MLPKVFRWLWGDLTRDEVKKFALLSATFMFVIGSYWLMRPLKDGIFFEIVGKDYQPIAKIVSLFILIPLILLYSKLVDMVEKRKLFYIIGVFYAFCFAGVAYFLSDPVMGLPNKVPGADRYFGWFIYVLIESFGSLTVALFWSFVASSTEPASAKRGFPLIISGAQIGSITGPYLATKAEILGIPFLTGLVVVGICAMMVMITIFSAVVPDELSGKAAEKVAEAKPKTGMMEGIRLILTRPYVMGVLAIATLYEVIGTIIDYQLKVLGKVAYPSPEAHTKFLAYFGMSVNGLALIFALLGTSFLMRRFGLTFCLLLFPVIVGSLATLVYFQQTLWVIFGSMIAIKGFSYALNNPAKEAMYLPTSQDVKYKAKGWIDMFGNRSAKGVGSGVNYFLKGVPGFIGIGMLISMGIVGVWLMAALYVGRTFDKLTEEGRIIE